MQALSASLIVLITASIMFWEFFNRITSVCTVASHDIVYYISLQLGVAAFTDETIVSWIASVESVQRFVLQDSQPWLNVMAWNELTWCQYMLGYLFA